MQNIAFPVPLYLIRIPRAYSFFIDFIEEKLVSSKTVACQKQFSYNVSVVLRPADFVKVLSGSKAGAITK